MSDYYSTLDRRVAHLAMVGVLAVAWAHEMNNRLVGLNVDLRHILWNLDNINLPSEAKRKLEAQIGQAVDKSEGVRKVLALFGQLPREDRDRDVVLTKLVQDTVKLVAPFAQRERCDIEIKSAAVQQTIRTYPVQLQQAITSLLLYSIQLLSGRPAKLTISVENASAIFITSDDPSFIEARFSSLDDSTEKKPLDSNEYWLFMAKKLVQDLGGDVRLAKSVVGTAVAIQMRVDEKKC